MTSGELYRTTGAIYALTTPGGTPFYVGATLQRPRERVKQHLRCAFREPSKHPALYELLAETGRCGFWVLQYQVSPEDLGPREQHHIELLQAAGFKLLQRHGGGFGCHRQSVSRRGQLSFEAKRRPRERGRFTPALPAIAGAAPTPAEEFWGPE